MNEKSLISIVIPIFNEGETFDELIKRCLKTCKETRRPFEIILVDDGSSDNSAEKIKEASERHSGTIIGVLLNRNYGQHTAVIAGFSHSKGDIVITLDADVQNPPEGIPRLVDKIEEGFDIVGGVRVPRRDTLFRKFASSIINRTVQKSTGIMMHDYGCMQRAYRRNIVNAMLECREQSTFIPVLANSFAHKTAEIEVPHEKRSMGQSKYGFMRLINLQFDLLTCMTILPLRLSSILGVIISLFGFGLGVYILIMRILLGAEWAAGGIFTLFAFLFILFGAQLIGIGLLGEYIGRIYLDVRARPHYIVQQVVDRRPLPKQVPQSSNLP